MVVLFESKGWITEFEPEDPNVMAVFHPTGSEGEGRSWDFLYIAYRGLPLDGRYQRATFQITAEVKSEPPSVEPSVTDTSAVFFAPYTMSERDRIDAMNLLASLGEDEDAIWHQFSPKTEYDAWVERVRDAAILQIELEYESGLYDRPDATQSDVEDARQEFVDLVQYKNESWGTEYDPWATYF